MKKFTEAYPDLYIYREAQFCPLGFVPEVEGIIDESLYKEKAQGPYTFWGIDLEAMSLALSLGLGKDIKYMRGNTFPQREEIVWFFYSPALYSESDVSWQEESLSYLEKREEEERKEFNTLMGKLLSSPTEQEKFMNEIRKLLDS